MIDLAKLIAATEGETPETGVLLEVAAREIIRQRHELHKLKTQRDEIQIRLARLERKRERAKDG